MSEFYLKQLVEQAERQAKALESIAKSLEKLSTPLVTRTDVLSSQDLDSLAGLPPGFMPTTDLVGKQVSVQVSGLRNQIPAHEIQLLRFAIERALNAVNGKGLRQEAYKAELLRHMRNSGQESMTPIQLESVILTYTGNDIESHWINQDNA